MDRQGRMLLQRRNDPGYPEAHRKWEFPGGGINFGESPEEALLRECREELGCKVRITKLLPRVVSWVFGKGKGKKLQVFLLCYQCTIVRGTPKPHDKDVLEVRWCTKKEALTLDILPGNKRFIKMI